MSRAVHRVLDAVVVVVVVALAAQPWANVEGTTRLTMVAIAAIVGFIAWQTNYAEKVSAPRSPITAADGRGAEIGRMAGRLVGDGVNVAKRLRKK